MYFLRLILPKCLDNSLWDIKALADESSFLKKNLKHSRLGNGPNEYERKKYIFDAMLRK